MSESFVIPDDHDAFSHIDTIQFNWTILSGSIAEMPVFLDRERDGGIYDYMQAFDYIANNLLREIRNKRLMKVVRVNDLKSLTAQDLLDYAGMVGVPFFEGYNYDTFKNQILEWAQNPNGGTAPVIRKSVYNFIGSGAFSPTFDPVTDSDEIQIFIPNSGVKEWGTQGESFDGTNTQWGSDAIGTEYDQWVSSFSLSTESFVVKITLANSGSSDDRTTYQYWSQDGKRATLQKVINSVKPAGTSNTLKIQQGF